MLELSHKIQGRVRESIDKTQRGNRMRSVVSACTTAFLADPAGRDTHDPLRVRKLLLQRKEIARLISRSRSAVCRSDLVGMQPQLRQVPPARSISTTMATGT